MKKLLIAVLMCIPLLAPTAFASTGGNYTDIQSLDLLFESSTTPLELSTLSSREMADTEGEYIPIIIGIVGIDMGLFTMFWAVYMPYIQSLSGYQSYSR